MTASGCGVTVKEYGHLLAHDGRYAEKAKRISAMTRDICEVVAAELQSLQQLAARTLPRASGRIAFQAPCTLQHGQQLAGVTERILAAAGFELAPVPDAQLCCGSAGTYSILEPQLAARLKQNKLAALRSGAPRAIATANIGCQTHLQSGSDIPVKHWITLLDERLGHPAA